MIFGHSYALSGFTLHQLFSFWELAGSVLLLGSITAVVWSTATRLRRSEMRSSLSTTNASTATTAKSEMSELPQTEPESSAASNPTRTPSSGWAKYAPILFAAVFGFGMVAGSYFPHYPTYEYYNVRVLSRVGERSWWMAKNDGEFLWTGCGDYDESKVIWEGYIMRKFRYEDRGNCASIKRADLGVWWQRDPTTKDVERIR